jgi:cyclopropane-fatty-acyl-phospholipid synthase
MIRHGTLEVVDPNGLLHSYGPPGAKPRARIAVDRSVAGTRTLLHPSLAIGEAYTEGRLRIEEGTLTDFLDIALLSRSMATPSGRFGRLLDGLIYAFNYPRELNWIGRAERNVRYHYDISHKLYELFLDSDMQYSCAYFRDESDNLEQAQLNKKHHLAQKLLLEPGMRVLDIGSGWGGLAVHIAREYGVEVTGVTLSRDQYEVSNARAAAAGVGDRVKFKLLDYRLEKGPYDRIVSVGMFEHVGKPHYTTFFDHLYDLLKDDGIAVLHTIARMTPPAPINPWIRRYIFPGGYLPSLSQLAPILERRGLHLTDFENWRLHYAKTLRHWSARLAANRAEVETMLDERFYRMWQFYLNACEAVFRHQGISVFQMQLAKRTDSVPLCRDYIYAVGPPRIGEAVPRRMAGE